MPNPNDHQTTAPYPTPHLLVAWGELIDKITILEIKFENLSDRTAIENVKKELDLIRPSAEEPLKSVNGLLVLKEELSSVNRRLWKIEDEIREKEHRKEFDQEFIALARSVYIQNDERALIKKKINLLLNSEIREEKSYKSY